MTSEEVIDLLYVAYNRDEAEVFSVDKAIRSGYEELYTTAPDVLDKKMKELDKEVERQALALINEKVTQVRNRKQQEIEEKEANFGEIIRKRAEALLRQNATFIGKDTTKEAIEMIQEEGKEEPEENEYIEENEEEIENTESNVGASGTRTKRNNKKVSNKKESNKKEDSKEENNQKENSKEESNKKEGSKKKNNKKESGKKENKEENDEEKMLKREKPKKINSSKDIRVNSEEYKGGNSDVGEEAKKPKRGRKPKASNE